MSSLPPRPVAPLARRIDAHAHPAWLYRHPLLLRGVFGWYRLLYQRTWVVQRALERELRRLPTGATVFDAGCGEGLFLFRTARRFPHHHFVGGDVRASNLRLTRAYLKRTALANVTLRHSDLLAADTLPAARLLYCVGVLHLLPDDRAALRNLHRAAGPGARLLLYTPVYRRRVLPWFAAWYRRFANYEATHARRIYTDASLRTLLTATGWEVEEMRYTNGTLGIVGYELYTGFFLLLSAGTVWQRPLGLLGVLLTLPLVVLLNAVDYWLEPRRGNGVLLTARRITDPR